MAPRGTDAILAPDQQIRKSRWGVLARKQACVRPGDPEPLKPLTQACRGLGGLVLAAAAVKGHAHQAQSQSPLASDPRGPTAQRGTLKARGSLSTQTPRNRGEGAARAAMRPPRIQAGRAGSFLSLQVRTGQNGRRPQALSTHLSLKSRKTLASELPPAIMDTSMALRKL